MKNERTMVYVRTALLVLGSGLAGGWLAPLVARAASATGASLSYAGTLSQHGAPVTTPQTLGFAFKKAGMVVCYPAGLQVTPDSGGHFTVSIPLASCPDSLFDGTEVKIDIAVEGNVVIADQPITPVPSTQYAEQVGFPDCPLGYDRDKAAAGIVLCRKGADEIVRVGVRSSSFWIDRYEATVWENPDGTGALYGAAVADYPLPVNGQLGAANKGYALSKAGHLPSTMATWFQADVACRASGKRLPRSDEWGFAARGTLDPGNSAGEGSKCRTNNSLRLTGAGVACVSMWGAEDMIGNVSEIVAEWAAAPPISTDDDYNGFSVLEWGSAFNDDATTNLVSYAAAPTGLNGLNYGTPASLLRGGGAWEGAGAGIFNLNMTVGVQGTHPSVGFRCVTRR
jgi:formylglycine-generating enzyme required for sulfatase activity